MTSQTLLVKPSPPTDRTNLLCSSPEIHHTLSIAAQISDTARRIRSWQAYPRLLFLVVIVLAFILPQSALARAPMPDPAFFGKANKSSDNLVVQVLASLVDVEVVAQTSNSIPFSGLAAISTELCITSDLEIENLYVLRIRRENGAATNRTGDTAAVGGDVVHIFLGGAKVVGAQFGAVNVEVGRADMRHLNQNDARSEAGDDPLVEWRNSFGLNELALSSDVDGSGISLLLNVYSECILGVPMLHL